MEKILAFFLGLASVRVQCACPEEVLNACAGTGIVLRKVQLSEDGLTLCVRRRDLAALRCVCTGLGARISAVRVYGVLPFAERIRKRYVLLAGAVICILAVWLSSLFIWQITVSGNTGVRTGEILSQLEELGVRIARVADGREAVRSFAENPPETFDIILMDIMMPEMNGYEATAAIRALPNRPDALQIPIIAMTANAFAEDVQASLNAGMNGHLSKPIVMDEVVKMIASNLGV